MLTEADKERLAKLIEAEADQNEPRDFDAITYNDGLWDGGISGLRHAARIIREQPAEPAWIAVEDRLPEDGERVIAFDGHPTSPDWREATYHASSVTGHGEAGGPIWQTEAGNAYYVTHWMRVQPPPA
jgi:hypothetical protein